MEFKLKPNKSLTREMAKNEGLAFELTDQTVDVSDGNPGAMTILIALSKELSSFDFKLILSCLKIKRLNGSKLYVAFKGKETKDIIKEFHQAGWL